MLAGLHEQLYHMSQGSVKLKDILLNPTPWDHQIEHELIG